jgi:hypothetical protein
MVGVFGFGLKGNQAVALAMVKITAIVMAVALVFGGLPGVATSQQSVCVSTDPVEFVQITAMQLDAGEETYEAFRILGNGRIEWARWTSYGYLLDYSQSHDGDSDIFNRVLTARSVLKPSKPHRDDGALGRRGFWLEIATLSKSGAQITIVNEIAADLAALIDELRRDVTPAVVQPGLYVWTRPYSLGWFDKPDIDLRRVECDSAVTLALAEALATGQLIVRADDGIQTFIAGERANRIAFSAKLAVSALLFGIVSAK